MSTIPGAHFLALSITGGFSYDRSELSNGLPQSADSRFGDFALSRFA